VLEIERHDIDGDGRRDVLSYVSHGRHDAPGEDLLVFSSKHRSIADILIAESGGHDDDEETWKHVSGCWETTDGGMTLWLATEYTSAFANEASACVVGVRIADDGDFELAPIRGVVARIAAPDAYALDDPAEAVRPLLDTGTGFVPTFDRLATSGRYFPACPARPALVTFVESQQDDDGSTATVFSNLRVTPSGRRSLVTQSRSGTRGCLRARTE
jgi:hypothetical protein